MSELACNKCLSFLLQMAVCIPYFDPIQKHAIDTCQLPMEVQWGNAGLQVGNIRFCPQIPTLWMQRVSLNTLLSYVGESRFCPKDASSMKASEETAVLLLFVSNVSYTDIEYVHIGLVFTRNGRLSWVAAAFSSLAEHSTTIIRFLN